jgi:hypothetical protein
LWRPFDFRRATERPRFAMVVEPASQGRVLT